MNKPTIPTKVLSQAAGLICTLMKKQIEQNRQYIRAIRALLQERGLQAVYFEHADYAYEEDIPHIWVNDEHFIPIDKVGVKDCKKNELAVEAACRTVVLSETTEDIDLQSLFYSVYDDIIYRDGAPEADEWLEKFLKENPDDGSG